MDSLSRFILVAAIAAAATMSVCLSVCLSLCPTSSQFAVVWLKEAKKRSKGGKFLADAFSSSSSSFPSYARSFVRSFVRSITKNEKNPFSSSSSSPPPLFTFLFSFATSSVVFPCMVTNNASPSAVHTTGKQQAFQSRFFSFLFSLFRSLKLSQWMLSLALFLSVSVVGTGKYF